MQFGVITLFPEMFDAVTGYGITGRAVSSGLLSVQCFNPRQWTQDRHQTVDDRPYGGGPGMVMQIEPLRGAIHEARRALGDATPVAYLSPQGQRLDQAQVRQLAKRESMILLAGRYEGVDERLLASEVDEEWSLGDYVLSGGELPAMVLIDAVARLQAGALGHERSAQEDSFEDGLLDCPHFTRPETWRGWSVPEVLRSGDHEAIRRWRLKQSLGRTWQRRPDLLDQRVLTPLEQQLLDEYKIEQGEPLAASFVKRG
ncbi:MAG TPA: tRNA (guanosine(37)-N1)-methyltransferase TrmD [Pseudomonadales bacterium]